ncbi:MAG: VanZ family protein [Clostridium sp.]|nr:VanZ family protein [Clostridium sp.]
MKTFLRIILKPMSFLPAILVMALIFRFSAQTGTESAKLSSKVSRYVVTGTEHVFGIRLTQEQMEQAVEQIHYYVRKLAHMTIYFVLAVSVAFPLYVYGVRGIWLMLTAGVICVGYAGLDEYHQSFVAGRGPSVKDVAIDGIGVFLGIIFTRILGWTGRMTIFRPLSLRSREDDDR